MGYLRCLQLTIKRVSGVTGEEVVREDFGYTVLSEADSWCYGDSKPRLVVEMLLWDPAVRLSGDCPATDKT